MRGSDQKCCNSEEKMKTACVLTCSCMSRSCFLAAISKMNSVLKSPVARLIKINKCKCDATRKFACSLGYFHRHLKSEDTERYSPFELHSSWLFFYDLMYNFNFSSCEQTYANRLYGFFQRNDVWTKNESLDSS